MNRFMTLLVFTVAAFWTGVPTDTYAGEFHPRKPLRFIVPLAAGSSADVAARALAKQLASTWSQPVIVDNRPGASTIIGSRIVAGAPADGHTFGWVIAAHAINPSLYSSLPYDTARDFSGVTLVYQLRIVIVASPAFPASSVSELVALAKARTRDVLYASPVTGSGPHLLGELFKLKYGIEMTHVGYKGGATAHPDVISGRVPVMFDTLPSALPLVISGKLKPIAVVGDMPLAEHPEFPVLKGLLPAHATTGWNGIVVPSRTPRRIVDQLNADIGSAVRSAEIQAHWKALVVETITSTPAQFDAFIREDIERWGEIVQRAKITLDVP
jgi:tripartite-type tricarboxylate transporter receptor subunit TctC